MGNEFWGERTAFSSKDETWRTPRKFFDELNQEFDFGLDAAALQCSTLVPNNWLGPDHDDVTRRDCLTVDWCELTSKTVFLNPPYSRGIGRFMEKASSYSDLCVVCLVPARTDTSWFHDYVFNKNAEVRFLRGRLKFNDGPNAAPFPSAVVVFKPHGY